MDSAGDIIFPFILDILSKKPLLEDNQKNILRALRYKIRNRGLKINNLQKEFEQTIQIGQTIGIFRISGTSIRLPFFRGSRKDQLHSSRRKSPIPEKRRSSSRRRGSSNRRKRQSRSRSYGHSRSQRRKIRSS